MFYTAVYHVLVSLPLQCAGHVNYKLSKTNNVTGRQVCVSVCCQSYSSVCSSVSGQIEDIIADILRRESASNLRTL